MEKREKKTLLLLVGTFLLFYFMPMGAERFEGALLSGFELLHEYAREHILTCLLPAFFIAGAIAAFVKKEVILRFLGGKAKKHIAYGLASVSGIALAVCSCTILPIFAGIRKRGAGLGPATTFLFSGPAINIAAIFLTLNVLGFQIGIARIVAAVLLAVLVGLSMQLIFREKPEEGALHTGKEEGAGIKKSILALFFLSLLGILIVNGLQVGETIKYTVIAAFSLVVVGIAVFQFQKETRNAWLKETWNFTKLILPVLFIGVFVAGFIMPFIPERLVENIVGDNSVLGNIVASVFGIFMYFSTLTEVPILQALTEKGMHHGPALALLLGGPSLSLPNMLVIRKVLGNKKTSVYILLVIIYSTIAGLIFGYLF